jgi:hypothetical protein
MSFCTITTSRGDRPKLLEFCKYQLSRMTVKPDRSYFIDHPPADDRKDLIARVQRGIAIARGDGFDKVYIVEDDDFYPANYFERMELDGQDFIGCNRSLYYNINNRTYEYLHHPNHSSLYCTAFKISALTGFQWPEPQAIFLDLRLWRHAKKQNKKILLKHDPIGVSIKHNIGVVGGSGHRRELARRDPNLEFLKSQVDSEAFEFYKNLIK